MNIKNILNKSKDAIKSGVDKGVKNSKELYELSKKRANSEIHKQTKSIATKVIDDTISKAKSSADKSKLKDAKNIVKKVYEKGGKVDEIKVGDFIKKKGSNIGLEVKEVGNDWRSKKDYITIYNDVTNQTTTLVDWSDYEKESTFAKGGHVDNNMYLKKDDIIYVFQYATDKNGKLAKGIDIKYVVGSEKEHNLQRWAKVQVIKPMSNELGSETYKGKKLEGEHTQFDKKIKDGEVFVFNQSQSSKYNTKPISIGYTEKERYFAKGGHVGKGELVWGKLSSSEKAEFLRENFTPLITPRTQEILVGKAYNFLPKQVKIKFEAKYADVDEYEKGGKIKFTLYKIDSLSDSKKQVLASLDGNNIYIYENGVLYDSKDGYKKGVAHRMSKIDLEIKPFDYIKNDKFAKGGSVKDAYDSELHKWHDSSFDGTNDQFIYSTESFAVGYGLDADTNKYYAFFTTEPNYMEFEPEKKYELDSMEEAKYKGEQLVKENLKKKFEDGGKIGSKAMKELNAYGKSFLVAENGVVKKVKDYYNDSTIKEVEVKDNIYKYNSTYKTYNDSKNNILSAKDLGNDIDLFEKGGSVKGKFEVELSAEPNPDYSNNPKDPRGKIKIKPNRVKVSSFAEASKVCQKYIDDNDLGGGNWTGGTIYEDGKEIAYVSYNGRIWEGKEWSVTRKELFEDGGGISKNKSKTDDNGLTNQVYIFEFEQYGENKRAEVRTEDGEMSAKNMIKWAYGIPVNKIKLHRKVESSGYLPSGIYNFGKYEDGGAVSDGDVKFNYMMLDRLRSDCDYYLGNGNRSERILRGENVNEHIKEMKRLWNNLKVKPEWLSMEDIEEYEKKMKNEYEDGGGIDSKNIDADLENFDIDDLDGFETMLYEQYLPNLGKVGALQVIINNVEGDYTQLSEKLAELAERQTSNEEWDEESMRLNGYEKGGSVDKIDYENSIGFIPMDLEQELVYISKWGNISIKETINILNAIVDSGLTTEEIKPILPKSTMRWMQIRDKKTKEVWNKIEKYYKGNLIGNKYFQALHDLISKKPKLIDQFRPFRKFQKYEQGGTIQDANSLFKKYEKNEDNNYHAENVLLLAKHFGTDEDIDTATKIIKERNKVGYMPKDMSEKSSEISSRLYPKLIQSLNKTNDKPNTNTMTQEQIQELIGITKSTNKVASEIATKKLKQLGLDANGKEIKAEEPKQVRKVVAKKVMPKKVATAPKKVEKSNEPDCDDLYEQYAKRQKAQKKAKNAPQKTETTKNKEKIEKVEDSLDAQFKSGKLTKAMLQKMYTETKALLVKIEKYLAKL